MQQPKKILNILKNSTGETVMNNIIRLFYFILAFMIISVVSVNSQTTITLIHVNDSHSHLDGIGPRNVNLQPTLGGIARAAAIIGTLKASEPNPILLHGGDFCVGDFFYNNYFGVPELQILNSLGFDAMTVGNHEFDLGPSTLESVFYAGFAEGSFPVVSANLDLSGYPSLSNFISPYVIKNMSGVKVGIFGMTIPAPLSNPSPVIIKENIPEITYATVTELQAQGCGVIVMLSHLGFANDSAIVSNVPGVNFVIGAHDHYSFPQPRSISSPGGTTYIVEAGSFYKNVGKLTFTFDNGTVSMNSYDLIPVTDETPGVHEIEEVINTLKQGIEQNYGNVFTNAIGTAGKDIEPAAEQNANGWKDSPIGNLVTDAYRNSTGTAIAITADGLISDKLYHGPLVGADVFRVVSYGFDTTTGLGFRLVKCEIRGMELIKGLETSLAMLGVDNDFFVQVSGIKFEYNITNPPGQRVVLSSVRINGSMILPHKKYSLTLNEGLYGILTSLGVQVEKVKLLNVSEYEALKNFITTLQSVSYSTEGRITETNTSDKVIMEGNNSSAPLNYKLFNNYPNPFNPSTTIKFELPENAHVMLVIYDVLGREVKTLVNDVLKPGAYEYQWNASEYSSGVYFYKLITPEFSKTKRMVLVK